MKAAKLIEFVLTDILTVREALLDWPPIGLDPSIDAARHALIHYEADETQQINSAYREEQLKLLFSIVNLFEQGASLPQSVMSSYDEFYGKSRKKPLLLRLIDTVFIMFSTIVKAL